MESIHTIKFRKWLSRSTPVQRERLYERRREANIVQYYKKREHYLEKIECDVCGVCVCRQNMNEHQKTQRCKQIKMRGVVQKTNDQEEQIQTDTHTAREDAGKCEGV